jgi:nucleoid-associated protein YgaU
MPRTDGAGGTVSQETAPANPAPETAGAAPTDEPVAEAPATEDPAAQAPATDNATAPATGEAASETAAAPQTVEQAPLTESKSSVIIRRGDTLWQISRRVYGAGVRYTTIYMANEDQIVDPDRIQPGQIFGVPDKAMPDAQSEEIHRKHMTHQP